MLLVNTCVFDSCCQTTLLRWTILQSEDERLSLTDFYDEIILFMTIIMIFIVMDNGNARPPASNFQEVRTGN